jgi:hypothetical protein
MRNTGQRPVDVTLLYIEAEAQIDCFNDWGKARFGPGEVKDRIQGNNQSPFRLWSHSPVIEALLRLRVCRRLLAWPSRHQLRCFMHRSKRRARVAIVARSGGHPLSPTPIVRRSVLAFIKIATIACVMLIKVSMRNSVLLKMPRFLTSAAPRAKRST